MSAIQTERTIGKSLSGSSELTYISLIDKLCNADGCLGVVGSSGAKPSLLVVDYGHLSPAGSLYVGQTIIQPALSAQLSEIHR